MGNTLKRNNIRESMSINEYKLLYTIYDENYKIIKIGPAKNVLDLKNKNKIDKLILYKNSDENIKNKINIFVNTKNISKDEKIYYDSSNKNIIVVIGIHEYKNSYI